jgi:hypothetical protein
MEVTGMEQADIETKAQALEHDIERDREELDRTLTELREKLTIEHLVAETRHHLEKAVQSSIEIVRRHPLPAATLALLATGAIVHRSRGRRRWKNGVESLGLYALLGEVARRGGAAANGSAGDVLHAAYGAIPERVAAGGREVARETGHLLHEARQQVRHGSQRMQHYVEDLAKQQPGLLNALAMALGSAVMTALTRRR